MGKESEANLRRVGKGKGNFGKRGEWRERRNPPRCVTSARNLRETWKTDECEWIFGGSKGFLGKESSGNRRAESAEGRESQGEGQQDRRNGA